MSSFSDSPRTLLETSAVGLLVLLLLVAPWPFGGYFFEHQFYMWIAALACTLLTCLSIANHPRSDLHPLPSILFPVLTFLIIAGAQLLPLDFAKTNWSHAVFADWMPAMSQRATWSIDPSLTRVQVLRLACAAGLIWSASYLFEDMGYRRVLFWTIAVNGALLTIFGLAQQLTWNGKLFWVVELTHGGQPFASYVNRNHAAGYLNMSLACALGIWWWLQQRANTASQQSPEGKLPSLAAALLVLVNLTGVLASLSRGGVIAAVVGILLVIFLAEAKIRVRVMGLFGVVIVLLGIILATTNVSESLHGRLAELQSEAQVSTSGRLQHWSDTSGAVLDSPLGTGLGTYRYANRPYQAHRTAGEFHNADNLYFETLVEMGWPGLALVIAAGFLAALRVRRIWRVRYQDARPLAVFGLYLLVTQGLQAATDFGPLMTANMLTLAVLLGCLYVPASDQGEYENPAAGSQQNLHMAVGVLLLLPGIPALMVFDHAVRAEQYLKGLPEVKPGISLDLVDQKLGGGGKLLKQFPDHSQIRVGMGKMYVAGYRESLFERLKGAVPEGQVVNDTIVWNSTSLATLYGATHNVAPNSEILEDLAVTKYLIPGRSHWLDLRITAPAVPDSYQPLAATAPLLEESRQVKPLAYWKADCAFLPDSAETLLAAGRIFQISGDAESWERAWRRALIVNRERPGYLLERMRQSCEDAELLAWLPDDTEMLAAFASSTADSNCRETSAKRLLDLLDLEGGRTKFDTFRFRGQACELLGDFDQAVTAFRQALALDPNSVETRIALAKVLDINGQAAEALQEYEHVIRIAPQRSDVRRRIEQISGETSHP